MTRAQRTFGTLVLALVASCSPTPAPDSAEGDAADGEGGIVWHDYQDGWATARRTGKPLLIDFTASWCPPCRMLEKRTLSDPDVIATARTHFVTVRVDVDHEARIAQRFRVDSLPTLVLVSTDGKELKRLRGFHPPRKFQDWLLAHAPS